MDFKIKITTEAEADLRNILNYLSENLDAPKATC